MTISIATRFYDVGQIVISVLNADLSQLIEVGENANGRWERYSNGVLKQYQHLTRTNIGITSALGAIFHSNIIWTFPVPFIDATRVVIANASAQGGTGWAAADASAPPSSTQSGIRLMDAASRSGGTAIHINLLAIGRWK